MNRRITIWIVGCFVTSAAIVILLVVTSGILKDRHNSFLRQFPPHPISEGDTIDIRYNSYYIAGGTSHTIYLGNYKSPLHLLVINQVSTDTQHVHLRVQGIMDQKFWSPRVKVDSPYFYLLDGAVPKIYRGYVDSWSAALYTYDNIHYRDLVPAGFNSFFIKTLGGASHENVIGKISTTVPHYHYNGEVLQKQIDGLFCTDGMLHYDQDQQRLVYLYYYRNEFLTLDTTLSVMYRGHTIDTISRAQIKVASLGSTGQHTMASPPLLVNKGSSVSGNHLFVNSNLLARNQSSNAFDYGEVIDVYTLDDTRYRFSFYLYHYPRGKRMNEFRVFGSTLVVLHDNFVRLYHLKPEYFLSYELLKTNNQDILSAQDQE